MNNFIIEGLNVGGITYIIVAVVSFSMASQVKHFRRKTDLHFFKVIVLFSCEIVLTLIGIGSASYWLSLPKLVAAITFGP
jgi:hypothetical protein